MTTTVDAIYEQGVLRLLTPMPLVDGTPVKVTVTTSEEHAAPQHTPADILAGIAALPLEDTSTFSGRDHDQALYGGLV